MNTSDSWENMACFFTSTAEELADIKSEDMFGQQNRRIQF